MICRPTQCLPCDSSDRRVSVKPETDGHPCERFKHNLSTQSVADQFWPSSMLSECCTFLSILYFSQFLANACHIFARSCEYMSDAIKIPLSCACFSVSSLFRCSKTSESNIENILLYSFLLFFYRKGNLGTGLLAKYHL